MGWPCIEVSGTDVGFWPYSVGLLVKLCSFVSYLHWPSTVSDLGGVSFVELLILYERWAGEKLVLEMSVPKLRRFHCPISVSAVPAGPSIDIWRSCKFLGAMLRALVGLPGGLGRSLPCRLRAGHCRLRSIGWERCGHGLTSRPLEASGTGFLHDLLSLSLVTHLGLVCLLLMVLLRCGIVPPIFPIRSLLGSCRLLVVWLLRLRFSRWELLCGVLGLLLTFSGEGGKKKIRLTTKTNVRKRFGVDPWKQPFPKRWKADTWRDFSFS